MQKQLQIHPKYFGPNLRDTIKSKLSSDLEGTCTAKYGYIISITQLMEIGNGKIDDTIGFATVPVKFKAVVCKPVKNEVVDAVVDEVTKLGFFAKVGAVNIFVSKHSIPPTMKFETNGSLYTDDQGSRIVKNGEVRLRIVKTRFEDNNIVCFKSDGFFYFLYPIFFGRKHLERFMRTSWAPC